MSTDETEKIVLIPGQKLQACEGENLTRGQKVVALAEKKELQDRGILQLFFLDL